MTETKSGLTKITYIPSEYGDAVQLKETEMGTLYVVCQHGVFRINGDTLIPLRINDD